MLLLVLFSKNSELNLTEIWKAYLETIDLSKVNLNNGVKVNKVNIIFGLEMPRSKIEFEKIKIVAKSYKEEFFKCENSYKASSSEKEKKSFEEKIEQLGNNVYNEMSKYDYFQKYFKTEDYVPFFLSDYLKLFLATQFKSNFNHFSEMLNIVLHQRFNKIKSYKDLANAIMFLEGYDDYIFNLCHIFEILSKHFENGQLVQKINTAIQQEEIEIPEYTDQQKITNLPFFLVFESMLIQIMKNKEFLSFEDQNAYDIKEIVNYANDIEFNLNLFSRELFKLKNFNETYDLLSKTGENSQNNLNEYLAMINEETNLRKIKNNTKIIEIITRQINFLKEKVGKIKNSGDVLISVIITQFNQYKDAADILQAIIKLVINDNNLIINSKKLLQLLLPSEIVLPKENESLLDIENRNKNRNLTVLCEINSCEKTLLGDIMLNYFEIMYYFLFEQRTQNCNDQAEEYNEKIRGDCGNYFKESVLYLHIAYEQKLKQAKDDSFNNIKTYMSIAYIKCYLSNLVSIVYDSNKRQMIDSVEDIFSNDINPRGTTNVSKVIKIYVLKLLYLECKTYEKFKMNNFQEQNITWINDFPLETISKTAIDFAFVNLEEYDKYKKMYDNGYASNFSMNNIENKANDIMKNGIFNYFDLIYNTIISNLVNENYKNNQNYKDYVRLAKQLIQLLNVKKETKDILSLFVEPEKFKMQNSQKEFEMLMIGLKIAISCTLSEEKSFYKKLVSKQIAQTLTDCFIPGGEPDNKRLFNSYLMIKDYLNQYGPTHGAYICCDQCYFFSPCGYPYEKNICKICNQPTNIENHKLVIRKDKDGNYTNYRIYKNEEFKKQSEDKYGVHNEDRIPFTYFKNFEEKVKKEKENQTRGIKTINSDWQFFLDQQKEIRNLSAIAYRLLSWISYISIYFSEKANYITKEKLSPLMINGKESLVIASKNWDILKRSLLLNKVDNIIIFMNMIFPKLSDLIKHSPSMNTKDERTSFEKSINKLVQNAIYEYPYYKSKYDTKNKEILQTDCNSNQSIIKELYSPTMYNNIEYPFFEFFMVPSYPSIEKLTEIIELEGENYPVLKAFLNDYSNEDEIGTSINKLRYLIDVNPFANRMIDKYSYKITRKEAKEKTIQEEIYNEKEGIVNEYNNFQNAWNVLKDEMIQFKCRHMDKSHYLVNTDPIAYTLNDDGEIGYGMHLASMYRNFINYQNSFLQQIFDDLPDTSILKFYEKTVKKAIYVQEATEKEIVSIHYKDLVSILTNYTKRDCYDTEGNILYTNYKMTHYDLQLLNDNLGHCLLKGKRMFEDEEKQKFVVYFGEAYSGKRSSMLIDFINKYPQKKSDKQTKEKMGKLLKNKTSKESIEFMLSLQCFMCYLLKQNYNGSEEIQAILNDNLPEYVNLKDNFKFFFEEKKEFKLNNIIELYQQIEMKGFTVIFENLPIFYGEELNKKQKEDINKTLGNNLKLLSREVIKNAVMMFIVRYLGGMRQEVDIGNEDDLIILLEYREDIWDKEIFTNINFGNEIEAFIPFKIKIANIKSFYNILANK